MKTKVGILSLACLYLSLIQATAQSLYDDFSGTSVNTNLWNVSLPFGQSQVAEGGGFLTTTGRGTLSTVAAFSAPYTISGSVELNNSYEHFGTTLRSDLVATTASGLSQYDVLTGIYVEFSADGNQVSIQEIDQGDPNPPILVETNFAFTIGLLYDFAITDTGTAVSLDINDSELVSADTIFSTGNQIAFQSREFDDTSSSIQYIDIAPTPEPTSLALMGAAVASLLVRRKIKQSTW